MSVAGTNGQPVPTMPPPPHGTGFTCFETKRGREVRGGRTEFVVTTDALLVTWETGWSGRQTRRIPRAEVRAVRVEPDRTSSLSRGMKQLVIEYGAGQTLAPVRRRRPAETTWLAQRLREALAEEHPAWTPGGAARAPERPAGATPGVPGEAENRIRQTQPDATMVAPRAPDKAAPWPPHLSNARVRGGRGRMFIRVRTGNPFSVYREVRPFFAGVAAVAVVAAMIAMAALGGPVRKVPPALVFGGIALALVCGNVWAGYRFVQTTARRYVIVLSRRTLRVASVEWPSGQRVRHPPLDRAQIVRFAPGWSNDAWPRTAPEVQAHLADGQPVGYMRARPGEEHEFVAWHLTRALVKLPVPTGDGEAASGEGASGSDKPTVLSYGRPLLPSTAITFHPLPDGILITIPPLPRDKFLRAWPYAFGLLVSPIAIMLVGSGLETVGVRAPFEVAKLIALLPMAALAVGLLRAVRLRNDPVVISVDGERLYFDDPDSLQRRRSWPRHQVKDVGLSTHHGQHGRKWHMVEVFLRTEYSLRMCVNRGEWDRQRVADALRKALGLEGPPPRQRFP